MKFKLFLLLLITSVTLNAQSLTKEEVISLIEKQEFKFVASRVNSSIAPSKYLSPGDADIYVADTIKAHMPYFGRAYQSFIGEETGIKFTSTNFEYTVEKKKKIWIVEIKPKDLNYSTTLSFSISFNGKTSLNIIDSRRQSIHFSGYIEALK